MASSKDYLEYILDQDAEMDLPYEGAKEMLLVDNIENRGFLRELFETMYP